MTALRKSWIFAALLATIAAGACSRSTTTTTPSPAPAASERTNAEIEALYRARIDSARMNFTAADVRFMKGMIHHHAQALEMADLVPSRTDNSSIRTLAARITSSQRDEIALMQRWLRNRDQPVPEVHISESGVMVHGADDAANMPGMLTPEQMENLAAASGTGFDRLFLTYMIQHHDGAVIMVHELFQIDGAGQDDEAFKLASDVQADQTTEIARMKRMLDALPPASGSP